MGDLIELKKFNEAQNNVSCVILLWNLFYSNLSYAQNISLFHAMYSAFWSSDICISISKE